ncbi:unnamed protein product [Phyllotreta striolata]|uniref:ABC transporter domain-containing protein n=1 Tax=Phyllotreta striolata TaxID=444603 RepID=A0A9N9TIC6_PHYSR|nr:unnamed protein product [Phyllotreta striolata]
MDLAIQVKDVEKSYGCNQVLKKIRLNVPRGCIYGLLGSSGCGKTTLLSCIIGRNKVDNGDIYVFGRNPDGPLGSRVGYMPQEISLVREFTVKDSIYFFGRLYNVDEDTLQQRYHELVELLELPKDNKYIKDCSGGTQRRVSFAVTLVHKPKLLILDEPTVGTDSILRDRIWKYLLKLSQEDNVTVIITTHYIEETRQANKIGLMRDGTLLIEENPEKLLTTYKCGSLEETYLILSQRQENKQQILDTYDSPTSPEIVETNEILQTNPTPENSSPHEETVTEKRIFAKFRFKALLDKNFKILRRNRLASLFPVLLPGLQVFFFLIAVGKDPTNVPFGIVNEERTPDFCKHFSLNESVKRVGNWDCHIDSVSCRFVDFLNIPLIEEKFYDSSSEAMDDLEKGKINGFVRLHRNLSGLMESRIVEGLDTDDLPDEEIQVFLDMSSLFVGGMLKSKIAERYEQFHEEIYKDCGYFPEIAKLPLKVEEYFYGDKDEEFIIFMTPGIVTTMIYFMGVIMTCTIILDEKIEGIWERSIVAGVTSLELSLSHLVFQTTFMVLMALELMAIVFFCFQQPYNGSLWLIFGIIYLQGLAGVVLGFGISVVSNNHVTANVIVSGIFNPLVLVSGMMWPAEAINKYLLMFAKCLPLNLPTTALRYIIKKGLSFSDTDVLAGFGMLGIWILILAALSISYIKWKR